MLLYTILFYLLSALILAATGLAVTRRNLVHAVVYLVISFFGSAMLFYLLGAPFLAALEVIIYAGAVMILFLFIIMMLRVADFEEQMFPPGQSIPAAILALGYLGIGAVLIFSDPGSRAPLLPAAAEPRVFGSYLFVKHWLAIEVVSLLLLVALVGALYIGRANKARTVATVNKENV